MFYDLVMTELRYFFAYTNSNPLTGEAMRHCSNSLVKDGVKSRTWEQLSSAGNVIIAEIKNEIDSCDVLVAEVSDLNRNVLFEVGFAMARGKKILLCLDETREQSSRRWRDFGLFSSVGHITYSADSDKLASKIRDSAYEAAPLAEQLLATARQRESNAIFAPELPIKHSASKTLEKFLERQSHISLLGGREMGYATLEFLMGEIYRANAALIHLLGEDRTGAEAHNARMSYAAGFADGLDLPVLMVAEDDFNAPLDYREMLLKYRNAAELQSKVEDWLNRLPTQAGGRARNGRLQLSVELPLRSFGEYVAEYERDELHDYFIETAEYSAVLDGGARIFAGRKGVGKSATMAQVAATLSQKQSVLVVPIRPTAYELDALVDVVDRFGSTDRASYFLVVCWEYLVSIEISLALTDRLSERSLSKEERDSLDELGRFLVSLGVDPEEDLAVRLENVVAKMIPTANRESDPEDVARAIRSDQLRRLKRLNSQLLGDFERVSILIDNLDKNWDNNSNVEVLSALILQLLESAPKIERGLQVTERKGHMIRVSLALFIRTDIFEMVKNAAREPDKIGYRSVDWSDSELLIRVLEERYVARAIGKDPNAMWDELFCSEVAGLPTRDFVLWRVLPRPRDLILFCNAALSTATNRKHSKITDSDLKQAEVQYSKFAYEALLVEGNLLGFELASLLEEFIGYNATITADDLQIILAGVPDSNEVVVWLVASSFIGVETAQEDFAYVQGRQAADTTLRFARRRAEKEGRVLRYRVHPAFRNALSVLEDDLYGVPTR